MKLTLVVPGPLDWPASVLAAVDSHAPALSRLLATAGPALLEDDGLLASMCRACGIARQTDWPVAPWLARAAGIDPERAYWLCADPVTLVVGRDDVRLGGLVDDLVASDAHTLLAALNAHFATDGVRFVAPTPAHWFARIERSQRLATRPPVAAQGAAMFAFLPEGADAPRWRRWQNEVQMLLFEHSVNQEREQAHLAPVNSVWFWGGGTGERHQPPPMAIFAGEGRVRELALGSAAAAAPVPEAFDALPQSSAAAVWLAPIDGGDAVVRVAAIDREWMVPVERALDAGQLSEVELIIGGRARAARLALRRSSLPQRWRARFSPPRLSLLLAGFAAGDSAG